MKTHHARAWMIPFSIGAFSLLSSIPPLLFGVDPDPTRIEAILGMEMSEVRASDPRVLDLVTFFLRTYGLTNLTWSFLITVVSATAFRKGDKWAWYALWSLPAYFVGATVILLSVGLTALEMVLLPILLILSILGQLLGARPSGASW